MDYSLKLIWTLFVPLAFTACSKGNDPDFQSKIKYDVKPQVKDLLKGKSKPEILKMKYKELKATCSLETHKVTKGQLYFEPSGNTPVPVLIPENPVANPSENILTFDLKLQQLVDHDLAKDVNVRLSTAKDGQTLNVELTFKAIGFIESINVDMNKKKYIMKHTPVLSYQADYKLLHADTSTIVGKTEGKIYEKIEGLKNEIITLEIGADQYNFALECKLDSLINPEDPIMAREFANQWNEVDCLTPKNETEKALCK